MISPSSAYDDDTSALSTTSMGIEDIFSPLKVSFPEGTGINLKEGPNKNEEQVYTYHMPSILDIFSKLDAFDGTTTISPVSVEKNLDTKKNCSNNDNKNGNGNSSPFLDITNLKLL